METKKILIVGSGISGLSLAINLEALDIPYRIIEKQEKWIRKGLAMAIQGEGLTTADSMGILDQIRNHGRNRKLKSIESSRGKILKQFICNPEEKSFIIPRDVLHEALRSRITAINMGICVVSVDEKKDCIDVRFSDGSTEAFSLIVGADGINSNTRNLISTTGKNSFSKNELIYSGSVLWGITVKKKYNQIIEAWGSGNMCAMYPVENGTVFSFFQKAPITFYSSYEKRAVDIKKYFSSYLQSDIKEVLNNLPKDIFFDHVRYSRPLKWNKGRITLIGDACHSLSPLSGLGANLAMADAEGLAAIISENLENNTFPEVIEKYNSIRKTESDKAYILGRKRTSRGMLKFPQTLGRNIKIKQLHWKY